MYLCNETSARCCSDLIAPSVLSRIVATSALGRLKTNFSVSTCCCSVDSPSISSSMLCRPIDCSAATSAEGSLSPSGSGTSSSGCQRRFGREGSLAGLCADRKSQADKGGERHPHPLIDSQILWDVCVVS